MNAGADEVVVEVGALDDGASDVRDSLSAVLARITPLATPVPGARPDEVVRRLCAAINTVLDTLEKLTGVADAGLVPALIERVTQLAVTGDNIEVQIGVTGDLRVDRRGRLVVDELLASVRRTPAPVRPAALRDGVAALRRLLALLLLHGWAGHAGADQEACRAAVAEFLGHGVAR